MATVFKRGGKTNREGYWYVSWFDHTGHRQTKRTRTTDRTTAEQIARHHEIGAAKRREGLIDPRDDRYAAEGRRPLKEHLAEFKASLVARGNTAQHCKETQSMATKVVEHCGAKHPKDLTASSVEQAIRSIKDKGASLRTCNAYLRAIKSFSRRLARDNRMRDDALVTLQAFNVETDRRHVRRELSPEELVRLIKAAEANERPEFSLNARDRGMLYR